MKLFILDKNARQNAQSYTDQHLIEAIDYLVHILSFVHYLYDERESLIQGLPTQKELISTKWVSWVRSGYQAYFWSSELLYWLFQEYEYRFGEPHQMSCLFYKLRQMPKPIEDNYQEVDFPRDLPRRYNKSGIINSYRHYYDQHHALDKYTNRDKPYWFKREKVCAL